MHPDTPPARVHGDGGGLRRNALRVLLTLSLAVLPACLAASAQSLPDMGYEAGELRELTAELARRQDVPPAKVSDLLINLEAALQAPEIAAAMRSGWIRGLFVYHSVEAGVVFKYMQGEGLVSFKRGGRQLPIRLRAMSAGAMVGGSAMWGVGLVADLVTPEHFGGEYRGVVTEATVADSTTRRPSILDKHAPPAGAGNRIFMILSGTGVSANAGLSSVIIDVDG